MPEDNLEIIRGLYERMNQLGPEQLLALPDAARREVFERFFHPDLELRQSAYMVIDTAGTFRGYEGFLESLRELVEGLDDLRFNLGEARESGDRVVFRVRAFATGKGSGVPVDVELAHLWELKEGRVRRWGVHPTFGEALEAAGLSK